MTSEPGFTSVDGLVVQLGDDGVLRIVIDRPEKRNALDDVMVAGMIAAVEQAGTDEAVRVILITGRGDHFCGGFDIVGRNTANDASPEQPAARGIDPASASRAGPSPDPVCWQPCRRRWCASCAAGPQGSACTSSWHPT